MNFKPSVIPQSRTENAFWFILRNNQMVIRADENNDHILHFCEPTTLFSLGQKHYIGNLDNIPCYCAELVNEAIPEGYQLRMLRDLHEVIGPVFFWTAMRALQILNWDSTHRFCCQCGSVTERSLEEYAKRCPECGYLQYPRISPAIIVAVIKEKQILLVRGSGSEIYSVVAGYVDVGENLEEAVQREVMEEVHLQVKNITYFGSQPWAFSNALMTGFTAEYAEGEIIPDGKEIREARWFAAHEIPATIPRQLSISRKLINWFVETYS